MVIELSSQGKEDTGIYKNLFNVDLELVPMLRSNREELNCNYKKAHKQETLGVMLHCH